MSKSSLYKILSEVLKEKYPEIEKIIVQEDEDNSDYFTVAIGVRYSNLKKVPTPNEIQKEVRQLSQYVLGSKIYPEGGRVYWVYYFDPAQ